MPVLNTSGIISRKFLMPPQEDGRNFWVRIVTMIYDYETKLEQDPGHTHIIQSVYDDQYKEFMSYKDIINHIENQEDEDILWEFKGIVSHEGTLNDSHTNYKGSHYNFMVEREIGETTTKLLSVTVADDPVTCDLYDDENDLLQQDGRKQF